MLTLLQVPAATKAVAAPAASSPLWTDPAFVAIAAALIGAGAALLGAWIGGKYVMRSAEASFANQLARDNANRAEAIKGLLSALHDEMDVLWKFYTEGISADIRTTADGQALLKFYPLQSDFFTMFNGNAFLIGHIQPADFRKLVVDTYTTAKVMVDMLKMNNWLVSEAMRLDQISRQLSNAETLGDATRARTTLVDYAKKLKSADQRMHDVTPRLLRQLQQRGVISE